MRQLLWHRHRLAQMRTRVMNQLHVVALNEGLRRKKALWRAAGRKELESIARARWATRRRQDLLDILDQLTPKIQELTCALEQEVEKRPVTRRLMTHPGVGPLTALAYELVIGTPERFHCGKQIASYVGLVPEEKSSGDRRRLGHISKPGNVLLRFLRSSWYTAVSWFVRNNSASLRASIRSLLLPSFNRAAFRGSQTTGGAVFRRKTTVVNRHYTNNPGLL